MSRTAPQHPARGEPRAHCEPRTTAALSDTPSAPGWCIASCEGIAYGVATEARSTPGECVASPASGPASQAQDGWGSGACGGEKRPSSYRRTALSGRGARRARRAPQPLPAAAACRVVACTGPDSPPRRARAAAAAEVPDRARAAHGAHARGGAHAAALSPATRGARDGPAAARPGQCALASLRRAVVVVCPRGLEPRTSRPQAGMLLYSHVID